MIDLSRGLRLLRVPSEIEWVRNCGDRRIFSVLAVPDEPYSDMMEQTEFFLMATQLFRIPGISTAGFEGWAALTRDPFDPRERALVDRSRATFVTGNFHPGATIGRMWAGSKQRARVSGYEEWLVEERAENGVWRVRWVESALNLSDLIAQTGLSSADESRQTWRRAGDPLMIFRVQRIAELKTSSA